MGHLFSSDYQLSSFNNLVIMVYALERSMGGGRALKGLMKNRLYIQVVHFTQLIFMELSFLLCEMGRPSCLRGLIPSTT